MARPFADVVRDLAGGRTYEELTSGLGEIVAAVMDTRKPGKLTLDLEVKPNGENSVRVIANVKSKVPEPAKGDTIFFCTSSGSLLRDDPQQEKLNLRRVGGDEADELRREKEAV